MENIKINGELVFEIKSKQHWINSFPGAIADLPMSEKYLWIDVNGNIATCGEDFMFAENAEVYPIKIYHIQRTSHLNPKNKNYVESLKKTHMVVTELRIGNYVTLTEKLRREMWDNQISAYNEYFKVDTIYSDGDVVLELDDENVDFESKDIQPIELTEEWLLKLNFEKKEVYVSGVMYDGWLNFSFHLDINHIKNTFFYHWMGGNIEIKYVHQLQNLFFALTGEELTIKE